MKTGCFFRKCKDFSSVIILSLSALILERTSTALVDVLLFSHGIEPDSLGGDFLRAISGALILLILSFFFIRRKPKFGQAAFISGSLMLPEQALVSLTGALLSFRTRVNVPFSGGGYIAYIFAFAVCLPIAEELFFRSVLKLTGTSNGRIAVAALCSALVSPGSFAESLAHSLISGYSAQSTFRAMLSRCVSRLCGILIIYCGVRGFEEVSNACLLLSLALIICGAFPEFYSFAKEKQNGIQ